MPFGQQQVPTAEAGSVPADAYLLDVREQDEWDAGHVPGATHLPLGELGARAGEVPADRPVYVVCRSGGRSAQAAAFLNQGGWDATNVGGGMQAWAAQGRPMVTDSGTYPEVA